MCRQVYLRKALIALLVCTVFFSSTQAQEHNQKFSVQLQAGPSIPLGRFAHKSFSLGIHDTSGNAITGAASNVLVQYQLSKQFGISMFVGVSVNRQDNAYLEQEVRKGQSGNRVVNVSSENWRVYKFMPGVFYTLPISPDGKLLFKPSVFMGICKTNVPGFSFASSDPNMLGSVIMAGSKSEQKLPLTFCYQASLAFNYAMNKNIFFLVDANYFGASPVVKYTYYPDWPATGNLASAKKHYSLASINFFAGVGVRF